MRLLSLALLLLTLLFAPCPSSGATIHVPGDKPTIAEGLAQALPGDTVLVAPGVYHEWSLEMQRGVVLTSEGGPGQTTVDATGCPLSTVIIGSLGGGPATRISGFTFQNADYAIWTRYSSPVIHDNVFRDLTSIAIDLHGSAALIQDNLFLNPNVGILACNAGDAATIANNTFVGAQAGAVYVGHEALSAVVRGNIMVSGFAGVVCTNCSAVPVTLECNDAWGNSYADYYGFVPYPVGIDGNISEDPLFCDPDSEDFTLSELSPCAPDNSPPGCGLIGRYPVACSVPSSIHPPDARHTTWGRVKAILR